MITFLARQRATFKIFVISQDLRETWNKGKLFNAGFQIAMEGKNSQKYILNQLFAF